MDSVEIIVAELADEPAKAPADEPYGVPRRFGIGTLLVVTAAFGGLLALLRWIGASPGVVGFWVVFISLVGLAQAVLFRGREPRRASLVAGAIAMPLLLMAANMAIQSGRLEGGFICVLAFSAPVGAGCGYLAGGLAAGVFLVMDAVDKQLPRFRRRAPAPPDDSGAGGQAK